MAGNAWKVAAGCGIGCLIIIIGAASLGVGGYFLARGAVREVKQIADLQDEVGRRFGTVEDHAPRYGAIPSDRMEAFVDVRDAMAAVMESWGDHDTSSPPPQGPKGFFEGLNMIRGGVKAVSTIGRLIETRNRALLNAEMGFGEYYYLYATVYYVWLGRSPEDCLRGVSVQTDGQGHRMSLSDGAHSGDLPGAYRTTYMGMLRRSLAEGDPAGRPRDDTWRAAVQAELDALEHDQGRMPWADGLPEAVTQSLGPYRQRLEPRYWTASNCFELTTLQTDGNFRQRFLEVEEQGVV